MHLRTRAMLSSCESCLVVFPRGANERAEMQPNIKLASCTKHSDEKEPCFIPSCSWELMNHVDLA